MTIDLDRIEEAPHILDILLQTEDILDSLDVYCYKNWLDGEVVDGPVVRRHWISVSLLYPHHKMPDPRAALRLLKHDVIVEFSKVLQNGDAIQAAVAPPAASGTASAAPKSAPGGHDADAQSFWMVKIAFPRRLLTQTGADFSFYDDEVDAEDVESAKDSGIDDESGYQSGEQAPTQPGGAPGDPNASPLMPPAPPMPPAGAPPVG
jgi:hypothetical protein